MDKIQEKLLKLLKRIDDVCQEHSITYYLGNETALCAARWGGFANNCFGATVYMPDKDYDRFENITMSNPREHTVESMATNPDFPFPFLHYVDSNTTRINLSMVGLQEHPGIAVKVVKLVLYAPKTDNEPLKDKIAMAAVRFEEGFGAVANYPKDYDEFKLQKLREDNGFAVSIYNEELDKGSDNDRYYLQRYRERVRYFGKELFLGEPDKILFEGEWFNIPKDIDSFLSVIYGRWWKTKEIEFTPYSYDFVVDMDNPYSLYMPTIKKIEEEGKSYRKKKLEKLPILKKSRSLKAAINNEFNYYERTVDRFYCTDKYIPKKHYYIKLYKKGEFSELSEALRDYQEIEEKHISRSIPFAFDKDLYIILIDVLGWQGLETIRKKMIADKKMAFKYLSEIAPNNKHILDGSIYEYVLKHKYKKKSSVLTTYLKRIKKRLNNKLLKKKR